ncbi:unnamed protein product, partial [Rotaria sp. Silwood2]
LYSIYAVCAGQRSFSTPRFVSATYPPILLIANIEATITTGNTPRQICLKNQK